MAKYNMESKYTHTTSKAYLDNYDRIFKKEKPMMTRSEMKEQLQAGVCRVIFTKVNGEERDMQCTLKEDLLPEPVASDEEVNRNRPVNEEVLAVWDTKAEGWRSFRIANVVSFSSDNK